MSIQITRKIDYADIGAQLECADPTDCLTFAGLYHQSTDQAMAGLATYARFIGRAKRARLRGNIDKAIQLENDAETVIEHEIAPENRW